MRVFLQRFFFLQESKARRRQLWFISLFVLLGLSWPSPDQAWILPTRPTVLLPYLWTFISLHRGIPVHCVMPETWLYCTVYMAHTFYFSFSPHPQKKKTFWKQKILVESIYYHSEQRDSLVLLLFSFMNYLWSFEGLWLIMLTMSLTGGHTRG